MRASTSFRFFAPVAFVLATASCSSSSDPPNAPPVIDTADAPADATSSNGAYSIMITLTYHDADKDPVTKVHYKIPAGQVDKTEDIPGATADTPGAKFQLILGAPAGTYDYSIAVVDSRGAESAPVSKTITLK